MSSTTATGSRAFWNLADQTLSSLATFVVTFQVASASATDDFGRFAVAFALFIFLLGVSQSMTNQIYLMRFPAADPARARGGASAAAGLAFTFGTICALFVVPTALLYGGTFGPAIAAITLLAPLLFVQETWRAVLVGRGRPAAATLNDAVRAVVGIGAVAISVRAGMNEPHVLLLVWGLGGVLSAGLGAIQIQALPNITGGIRFAREHLDASRYLVAEWTLVTGAVQVGLLIVAALGTAADVGALRGARTLLGPLNIVGIGIFRFLMTELGRRPDLRRRALRVVAGLTCASLVLLALVCGLIVLELPDHVGRQLLGETWDGARAVIWPTTLYVACTVGAYGPLVVLRAAGEVRSTLQINAFLGVALLGAVWGGYLLGGVAGAAWAFTASAIPITPLFWMRMERLLNGRSELRVDHTTRLGSP